MFALVGGTEPNSCSSIISYVSLLLRDLCLLMFHPGNVSLYFHPLKKWKKQKMFSDKANYNICSLFPFFGNISFQYDFNYTVVSVWWLLFQNWHRFSEIPLLFNNVYISAKICSFGMVFCLYNCMHTKNFFQAAFF